MRINDTVRVIGNGSVGTIASQVYADPYDDEPTCLAKIEGSHGCCIAFGVADLEPVSLEQAWGELQAVPSYVSRDKADEPICAGEFEALQIVTADSSYAVFVSEEESREHLAAHDMTLQDIPRYICTECERVYRWNDDDIAAAMERPFMPCGHIWDCLGYVAVTPV